MICSMEGSTFATVKDLNMDYYHISFDNDIFPWGKYKHIRKLMGPKLTLIFFKMSSLSISKIWNMKRHILIVNAKFTEASRTTY